jgi:arylsulfatase A-like enzyme
MEKKKSIVLVTIDCLRSDHVGFMGYRRPTTPFLDAVANESVVFSLAIVAGAPTYYSFPAIFASRYPLALGRDVLGLAPGEPTITSVLKDAGYATAAFSAGNPYLSARFGYHQGFDVFRDFLDQDPGAPVDEKQTAGKDIGWSSQLNRKLQGWRPAMGPLRLIYDELYFRYCQRATPAPRTLDELRRFPTADVLVNHARDWLASVGDRPFFLWLHFMDPHSPYYPKEEALALMHAEPLAPYEARYRNSYWNRSDLGPSRLMHHRDEVIALYDAGIRWVDLQLARLRDTLYASNRWEECVLAVTADHGEEFLDHGGRYHPPSRLSEELIHVPLLVRIPGKTKRETIETPFSMLNLAPTLLDATDSATRPGFQGVSYWPGARNSYSADEIVVSESVAGCTNPFRKADRIGSRFLAVRDSRFKLTLRFDPASEQLYDLESDPGEQAPLDPSSHRSARKRLLERARGHLQASYTQRDSRLRLRASLRDLQLKWSGSFPRRSET